jgi:hypothetical protein
LLPRIPFEETVAIIDLPLAQINHSFEAADSGQLAGRDGRILRRRTITPTHAKWQSWRHAYSIWNRDTAYGVIGSLKASVSYFLNT